MNISKAGNDIPRNDTQNNKASNDHSQAKSIWVKIRKYIPLVILIAGAFIVARYFNITLLKEILDRYEKFGFAICILSYVVLSVTVIPSDPITSEGL